LTARPKNLCHPRAAQECGRAKSGGDAAAITLCGVAFVKQQLLYHKNAQSQIVKSLPNKYQGRVSKIRRIKSLYSQAGSAELARGVRRTRRGFAAMLCALQQSATTAGETRPGKVVF
jgi:hypothetical protein